MNTRPLRRILLSTVGMGLLLAMHGGCGSSSEAVKDAPAEHGPSAPSASTRSAPPAAGNSTQSASSSPWKLSPSADKATILGRVAYEGEPPKPRPINFGPEKKCHDPTQPPPTDESLIVAPDKAIRWVLVHVVGDVPGDYTPPAEPATLDQKGCIFMPHVLAVQAGQPILVLNSDEVAHNVRCVATRNPAINFILPTKGDSQTMRLDSWELGMQLKCDIHFWMNGQIHALRHPFFYVTGADGWFKIENIPPGSYKLEAQHEKLGKQRQEIEAKPGEVLTVDFVFKPK